GELSERDLRRLAAARRRYTRRLLLCCGTLLAAAGLLRFAADAAGDGPLADRSARGTFDDCWACMEATRCLPADARSRAHPYDVDDVDAAIASRSCTATVVEGCAVSCRPFLRSRR